MDATVADPLVGQVLDDRYRIASRVALGGMATVYQARDLKLDRVVALKVIKPALAEDEEFTRRFIGEARAAARLSHPNVVAVYDQGMDQGRAFLAMEYVDGTTLRDLLASRGRLGPREALGTLRPVLAAIGAAHLAGLVHRDVKPENVLVAPDGQVKVVDFGLARAVAASSQTKTGVLIGTVGYLAPEQVLSGTADARSDVYAAGVMLFELLTGRQPHAGETPLAVAYKHVNESVPAPSAVVPGLPPGLDALVAAATSHDPARRPANANQLLGAVDELYAVLPPDPEPGGQAVHHGTQVLNRRDTAVLPQGAVPGGDAAYPVFQPGTVPPDRPSALDRLAAFGTGRYALIGVGLVVLLLAGWITWSQTLGTYTDVPKLTGMPVAEAEAKAESKDLKIRLAEARYSPKVAKGRVLEVRPAPGKDVKKGSTITVVPSKGAKPVPVPRVAGLELEQAKQTLRQKGFQPGQETTQPSRNVRRGLVAGTKPEAGKLHSPDEPVQMVISSGIKVPGVVGWQRQQAEDAIRKAGLTPVVEERDESGKPPGTVLEQNPAADSDQGLDPGAEVRLIVVKSDCPFWNPFCDDEDDSDEDGATVPGVVGNDVDQAKQALRQAGFRVDVQKSGPSRRVTNQNPPAGTRAPPGTKVTIWA